MNDCIGFFPRGIDGIFCPSTDRRTMIPLVEANSQEEMWIQQMDKSTRAIAYSLHDQDSGPYPSTEQVLTHSNIHTILRIHGIKSLLLHSTCTPAVYEWAKNNQIQLLMTDYEHQRRFEDKIRFNRFLKINGLPTPAGYAFTWDCKKFLLRQPSVLQIPESMGGEGTFILQSPQDVHSLVQSNVLKKGHRYLLRELVDGKPYGITIFVGPGMIALSAIRLQCYYPHRSLTGNMLFAGIQWLPIHSFSQKLIANMNATFMHLGEQLYRRRFFGFANIDFMVDKNDRLFILECNPRMSSSTPQLLRNPGLISGLQIHHLFFDGFRQKRIYSTSFQRLFLPSCDYQGATLDLIHTKDENTIESDFPIGNYSFHNAKVQYISQDIRRILGDSEFSLFSFARKGQSCRSGDPLATILSDNPLYDTQATLSTRAQNLIKHFNYMAFRN